MLPIYVNAAQDYFEREIIGGRSLLTTVWTLELPGFPRGKIKLPRPPLQDIATTDVTYFDTDNVSTTIATSDYSTIKPQYTQGWIEPVQDFEWPDTYQRPDAVKVRFTAGSSATSDVEYLAKQGVLLIFGDYYAHRENMVEGISGNVREGVTRIADRLGWGHYG